MGGHTDGSVIVRLADGSVFVGDLVRGRFGGVDGEGALLLETPAGPRRIVSGELLGRAA